MLAKKLEKKVILYRNQFDDFSLQIFGDHRLDRYSLDLDGIMFRIRYMTKHQKDLDKINDYKEEFTKKASLMRESFSEFMYEFLCKIITIPDPFKLDNLVDVLAQNVKIDSSYVKFDLIIISDSEEYLKYIDESFEDNQVFNMFPDQYFRFYTDSYNDGIAKAYPELFENKTQDKIGTGDDANVFVHSLTLQTGERCSLNCFPKGTDILMGDFTHKDISEIKVGDIVIGFEENGRGFQKQRTMQLSKVITVSSHYESCFKISHPSFEKDLYVTPEHPFFTGRGEWVMTKDIRPSDGLMMINFNPYDYYNPNIESIEYITGYFLGGWLGDGTSTTGGYRTAYKTFRDYYHTRFVVKDQEMNDRMDIFAKKLGFKFGYTNFRISTKYNEWRPALYSGSKEVYEKYWNLVNTTLSNDKMLKNPNFLMGYAAGLFDAEGSIQGHTMRICNTDKKLLTIFELALQFLKLPYIYERPSHGVNKPVHILRLIGGIPNIIKFTMSCRNVIPRKTATHFIGTSVFRKLDGYKIEYVRDAKKVYNFETTTHTYIANRLMVHNCNYCLSGDTKIHMWNGTPKRIKDIQVGDYVVGFSEKEKYKKKEFPTEYELEQACKKKGKNPKKKSKFKPAKVLNVFHRTAKTIQIKSPYVNHPVHITLNHKVLTDKGWVAVEDIKQDVHKLAFRDLDNIIYRSSYLLYKDYYDQDVYNIETETGTYIASGLCVHNCYQFNKSEMRMSFDIAKEFIDHLLNDDYGYINRYNSPALILEFIGGEPLLEIKLTRKIYEYFLERCYELNHPWFTLHRLSICSNGMQYFDDEVQSFFKDYATQISFNISIDGNRELHDACRVQPNGEGSYDIDMAALDHFNKHFTPERNSKMTLSPQNISYLYESVVDFINHGMKVININCVFEEGWTKETAHIEYEQLKKLADYILDNDLENIYIAIFSDKQESRLGKEMDSSSCGGDGSMLAVRPNGQFYPCLRYMPSSVGNNVRDLCIGTVQNGMLGREEESDVLKELDSITRRSQTNDICWECPIASNCSSCLALGHTVFGTPNKRASFICIQHIAEHIANYYYWNLLAIKHPEWDLPIRKLVTPTKWNRLVINDDELDFLKSIESYAIIKKIENNTKEP